MNHTAPHLSQPGRVARRHFLGFTLPVLALGLVLTAQAWAAAPIRVIIWDEQQPEQKKVYSKFIGNELADHLNSLKGITAKSVRLDDPDQGLPPGSLDQCDVLIWWGHVRHPEVKDALVQDIVQRVKAGKLSFLALHATHWSTPFIELMKVRSVEDALKALQPSERATAVVQVTNQFPAVRVQPKYTDRFTPCALYRKAPGQPVEVTVYPANCCFPAVRAEGKPGYLRTLLPKHPIAKGLPAEFTLPQTEMYGEPFHIPEPDALVFDERWDSGDWFRSGCAWSVGAGKVFYFQPGHETYPVYKDANVLRIIENSVRWMGAK